MRFFSIMVKGEGVGGMLGGTRKKKEELRSISNRS
jgi:hypothetical protein